MEPKVPQEKLGPSLLRIGRARISIAAVGKSEEAVVAKGQTRAVKEKKKPKADKDKPKQMSAYKASQMAGAPRGQKVA